MGDCTQMCIGTYILQAKSNSLIRLQINVVMRVEKPHVDKDYAWKPLDFNLLRISFELLIDQNTCLPFLS